MFTRICDSERTLALVAEDAFTQNSYISTTDKLHKKTNISTIKLHNHRLYRMSLKSLQEMQSFKKNSEFCGIEKQLEKVFQSNNVRNLFTGFGVFTPHQYNVSWSLVLDWNWWENLLLSSGIRSVKINYLAVCSIPR